MLDLPITKWIEVDVPTIVNSTSTRVNGVLFDFNNTRSFSSVSFYSGPSEDLTLLRDETWVLSGDFYINLISKLTGGKTIAEELLTAVSTVVMQLQADDVLKDSLVTSGEMKIIPGNICAFLTAFN